MKRKQLIPLYFLLVYLALDSLSYAAFSAVHTRTFSGETGGKLHHYLAREKPADLLILGSSRAVSGLDPKRFARDSYNLAHHGANPAFLACLAAIVCESEARPKAILLNVYPNHYFKKAVQAPILLRFKTYYGRNAEVTRFIDTRYEKEKLKLALSRSYRFNSMLPSLLNNYRKTRAGAVLEDGFVPNPATERDAEVVELLRQREIAADTSVASVGDLEPLRFIIETAKKHDVELIMVMLPEFDPQPDLSALKGPIRQMCEQNDIKLVDYYERPLGPLMADPSLWQDRAHVNHHGAAMLTDDLVERLGEAQTQSE